MSERRPVILHVDDNDTNRYVVGRILTGAGYEVVQGSTGEQALELARQDPDLVLLDVQLPDMDGRDVCRRIKSDPATSHVMVLQISASFVRTEDRVQGLEGGADGYLTYPLEPQELLANVRALLRIKRAEEEARLVARQWEATFDAISDGVALVDLEGNVVRCSRRMTELLEKKFRDIVGRPLRDSVQDLVGEIQLLAPELVAGSMERQTLEVPVGDRWLSISADPVIDARGQKTGTVFIFADVTSRKQAEEALKASNQRLRLLSETANSLLLNDEPEAFIKQIYSRLSEHLGLEVYFNYLVTPDGRSLQLSSYSGIRPEIAGSVERVSFSEAPPAQVEEDVQESSDPANAWIRAMGLTAYACHPLLARDQFIGTICFGSRNRSHFTEDELALIQIVSDQVAVAVERSRLFTELQQRAEALAVADRTKDEFLAMLSHELRNPLGAISNALQVMDLVGAPDSPEAEHRATVGRQIHHLGRMVDDLLDVSRITQGKIELRREPVEVGPILQDALDAACPLIAERRHRLRVTVPDQRLWVEADATRIEQVILNLLNNAAKYTEPGGEIHAILEHEPPSNGRSPGKGRVVIRVRDNGVGIEPGMLSRVFDLFAQADQSLERAHGGLGIGLTLVKTLVRLHGGTVSAFSEGKGKGSEFIIALPAIEVPTQEAPAPPGVDGALHAGSGGPLSVLVVEDIPDARETLRELLELWGHHVEVAADGPTAVSVISTELPDVALVDIGLPGLDGYQVARRVRELEAGHRVHLVALTGYGLPEDREKALAAGFDTHLVKPVSGEKLMTVLQKVGKRQSQPV